MKKKQKKGFFKNKPKSAIKSFSSPPSPSFNSLLSSLP
uniref:Uncharacterized protein n=1 Tax=Anguilla anguilla TaxID=7936 RepID=A0A0E9Q1M1_ANGAN